jgi:hypothetical protein
VLVVSCTHLTTVGRELVLDILGLPARLDALAMPTRAGRVLNDASSKQGAAQGSKLLLAIARGAETSRDIEKMIRDCDHDN